MTLRGKGSDKWHIVGGEKDWISLISLNAQLAKDFKIVFKLTVPSQVLKNWGKMVLKSRRLLT